MKACMLILKTAQSNALTIIAACNINDNHRAGGFAAGNNALEIVKPVPEAMAKRSCHGDMFWSL
jgi:hypothetical protein